jgi:hypothetical protein
MIAACKETVNWWNATWFTPKPPESLWQVRLACGLIATLHFLAFLIFGSEWLGPNGWLNVEAGRFLIGEGVDGTGSLYRWSILYWFPQALSMVVGVGLFASIATAAGLGARVSPFLAWFCMSTVHHRAPILTTIHEPLLVAMLAYLTIDPGRLTWTIRPGLASGQARISVNIVLQLIRCHLWIWIAFSLSSMLAIPIWWNGEAGWLLIQENRGWLHLTEGWQWFAQLLTHAVIAMQAALLFCMIQPMCNWIGRWILYLFLLSVLLLLGDWMYASVLFAASLAVWPVHLSHRNSLTKSQNASNK